MRPPGRWAAAVVTAVTIGAGLSAGAGAAAGQQIADLHLHHTCLFPSGERPVDVRIEAAFPDAAQAGEQIRPTEVAASLTLPPAALADLTALDAAAVAADVRLAVTVTGSAEATERAWIGLTAPTTAVPEATDLALTAKGAVAPVTATAPGETTFAAGDLTMVLAMQRADGSRTTPAALSVACTLDPGQDARLATVPVAAQPSGPSLQEESPTSEEPPVGEEPPPGEDPPPGEEQPPEEPPFPPECGDIPPTAPDVPTGCTFIVGRSNVAKLKASAPIDPALLNIALANLEFTENGLALQHNTAELPTGSLPPSTATFLTFGFMPIRATMQLTQTSPIDVEAIGQFLPPFDYWIGATTTMSIRISDVTVNGVPLDVGPDCRSAEPMQVRLVGGTPEFTNIFVGGPLEGFVTIPPFSGCGVTEDLDPLLTGTVSGPDNYVKFIMGTLCIPLEPFFCPPSVPPAP
jgi:hypothetical protein